MRRISDLPHAVQRFRPGELIFGQGQECKAVFLVHSGAVELVFEDQRNRKHSLRLVRPGDLLGLPAAVSSRPYSKSAIAAEPVELHRIELKEFLKFLEFHPECRMKALMCLSDDTVAMQALFTRLLSRPIMRA